MKPLDEIIAKYNLTTNGKKHFGEVEGYQVLLKFDQFGAPSCAGSVSVYLKDKENDIKTFLETNKKELGLFSYKVNPSGITWISRCYTVKKGLENLEKTFLALINYFKEIGIDGSLCPNCGKPMEEKTLIDSTIYLCKECSEELNKERVKAEEDYQNSPNNYLKGALGAFLGAAIGGAAWVIIAIVTNYIFSLIAILIGYLAGLGYDLLKGKPNNNKIIIVVIVSLFTVIASNFLAYGLIVDDLFYRLANNSALLGEFIKNMVIAVVFGGIGVGYVVYDLKRKIHK